MKKIITCLLLLLALNMFSINLHAQANNAVAIYSLRLVNSGYQGAAITVRNGANNNTTNIGFSNGYLDTVTLKSFIGNGSAYVTKWFDQSGFERNAVQADLAKQPRIMNAGIIDRVQNQVAIYFNNSNLRSTDITIHYPVEIRSITAIKENTAGNIFKYGGGALNGVALGIGGANYNTNGNQMQGIVSKDDEFLSLEQPVTLNRFHEMSFMVSKIGSDSSVVRFFYDGIESDYLRNKQPLNGSKVFDIGGEITENGVFRRAANQYTSELIVYDGELSEADRDIVDNAQFPLFNIPPIAVIYNNLPELADPDNRQDLLNILKWIKSITYNQKTEYCWVDSYGRGGGKVISDCGDGYEKIGALCYPICHNGSSGKPTFGNLDYCYEECNQGYTNFGLTCTRGPSTLWGWNHRVGECLSFGGNDYTNISFLGGILSTLGVAPPSAEYVCARRDGWNVYFSRNFYCPVGYFRGGNGLTNAFCYRHCPEGYTMNGETCGRGADTYATSDNYRRGNTVLQCPSGTIPDETGGPLGLCYPACNENYYGIGPTCFSNNCPYPLSVCGYGCAKSDFVCAAKITGMVGSIALAAVNVATLGLEAKAGNATKAIIKFAGKSVGDGSMIAGWMVSAIRQVGKLKKITLAPKLSVTITDRYIKPALAGVGNFGSTVYQIYKVAKQPLDLADAVTKILDDGVSNFDSFVGEYVSWVIDGQFDIRNANYIKRQWLDLRLQQASSQYGFAEIGKGNGVGEVYAAWNAYKSVTKFDCLGMLPDIDPTGLASNIKDIVDAFQYDKCQPIINFPTFNSGANKYRHGEIKYTPDTFIPSPKPNSIDEFLNSVSNSWENLVKLVESMNAYDRNR